MPQFVYPFTLEPHIITLESSRRNTIAAHIVRREAYLQSREDEKERRKRDALRRIAPGFEPQGSVLIPTRASPGQHGATEAGDDSSDTVGHRRTRSVMEDLVDQLAALDRSASSPESGSGPALSPGRS